MFLFSFFFWLLIHRHPVPVICWCIFAHFIVASIDLLYYLISVKLTLFWLYSFGSDWLQIVKYFPIMTSSLNSYFGDCMFLAFINDSTIPFMFSILIESSIYLSQCLDFLIQIFGCFALLLWYDTFQQDKYCLNKYLFHFPLLLVWKFLDADVFRLFNE